MIKIAVDAMGGDVAPHSEVLGVIQAVQDRARPTSLIIWTRDMEQFLGCWRVAPAQNGVADWFAALGIRIAWLHGRSLPCRETERR